MSTGAWIGFAVGLSCVAVVAAFARWSAWWPHSDNRQNGVMLFGTVAGALAAVTLARAFVAVKSRAARVRMLVGAVAAAVLGWSVGYALMVDATRWAK